MNVPNRFSIQFAAFASSILLCGVTAVAQSPGGMQPQPGTAPGAPQSPNSGAMSSPMNQSDMNSNTAPGQTSPVDKMFVHKALEGGMAEVQLGQLALQKSSSDDVKQFAQKMVDDHTKMGDQMKSVAQQIGVKVPDAPSKKDQAIMAKLQGLNGSDFDKAYMKDMVKDHKTDLNDFKAEASNGSNPAVKDAANQGSQIISQHLQMAEQVSQKTGAMASTGGSR